MNILLYGSRFFGYVDRVKDAFIKNGHTIDIIYAYETTLIERTINKFTKSTNKNKIQNYLLQQLDNISGKEYEVVLMMGARGLRNESLDMIRKVNPKSRFILYLSADLKSHKFDPNFLQKFNKIISYSKRDSEINGFEYIPWFYSSSRNLNKAFDISFIGSLHKSRLNILKQLYHINNIYYYIYTSRQVFLRNIWKWISLFRYVYFKALPYEAYIELLSKSKATLDLPDKHQGNITTRPIEAIGTKTKIITTSESIKNYDFYNTSNILIIEKDKINNLDIHAIEEWLKIPYLEPSAKILKKYHINHWIHEVIK